MAAIAGIGLSGPEADAILGRIFSKPVPACGRAAVGTIRDGAEVIDSVVVGCEAPRQFVIHCHGNPLLAERILRLCERLGAVPQRAETYLFAQLKAEAGSLIEAEARLEMTRAATREGIILLSSQISGGLTAWAARWNGDKSFDIQQLRQQCDNILKNSDIAQRLFRGVRIVMVGPPNSGKSTLLNRLAAQQTALVSDTAGTTRDWVSTFCRFGPLRAEVVDTAGLDIAPDQRSELDQAAQKAAHRAIASCTMLLNVRDCTRPAAQTIALSPGVPVLNVFTKSDLLAEPAAFSAVPGVLVSAKTGYGIDELYSGILDVLEIDSLADNPPVAFTPRQREILQALAQTDSPAAAREILAALI